METLSTCRWCTLCHSKNMSVHCECASLSSSFACMCSIFGCLSFYSWDTTNAFPIVQMYCISKPRLAFRQVWADTMDLHITPKRGPVSSWKVRYCLLLMRTLNLFSRSAMHTFWVTCPDVNKFVWYFLFPAWHAIFVTFEKREDEAIKFFSYALLLYELSHVLSVSGVWGGCRLVVGRWFRHRPDWLPGSPLQNHRKEPPTPSTPQPLHPPTPPPQPHLLTVAKAITSSIHEAQTSTVQHYVAFRRLCKLFGRNILV